jgi:Tol biopolymer transport system component
MLSRGPRGPDLAGIGGVMRRRLTFAYGGTLGLLLVLVLGSKAAPASAASATDSKARNGLIVFMRPGTIGEYDLWRVRPNGTGLRRLTKSPANRSDYNPTWSPAGSVVLFERRKTADVPGSDEALYEVGRNGGVRQITHCHGRCWSDSEPAWAASGKRIAFGRATGPRSAQGPSLVAIHVANADGSHTRQVSKPPHGYEDHYPTWSPNEHTIVFQRNTSDSSGAPVHSSLIAVDVATRTERTVYRFPKWAQGAGQPDFSPSGKQIMFNYWCIFGDSCPPSTRASRNATIAIIGPDGTRLRRLHLRTDADSGAWSPNGNQIVFRCRANSGPTPFRVCRSKPDGTNFKRFPWPVNSAEPDWGTHQ